MSTADLVNRTQRILDERAFARLRELRYTDPGAVRSSLDTRRRRPLVRGDGRLFIVAADHPARGALGVRKDGMAMADRYGLLERLALALSRPGVDGVLGTPDIIDDLALLGALDDKIAVGSMNRGGLRGSVFEMDDRYTGYDVPAMVRDGVDAAKLLVRVNLEDAATVRTLEKTADAVTASAAAGLPILLEPFMSSWREGRIVNDLTADAVINSVAIASGLGASSAYTWLKLPVVDDMERVMAATTLPTLLLGGDADGSPDQTYASWDAALGLPGVHGLVVGRTLLYPQDGDVAQAVDIAAGLVHGR
ncbi:class I fructose-bisphosphate aldolase [Leifsonia sp. 21MFCrub1.1]|uniref:class I fructose-bisphosphate aldolase n=1 Tax=Leifsonia sp. 21MFCrub1.1 TaxID=1798223 RepID=UPI000892877B|nr:aldolase [Leifsonia sp. 21MFCrub1.1]SEB08080.1 Fructose-bisphosphate aldolase class Ia, DhnA family [Leifsonia sp. 21MFCrub1.1]